MLSWNTCNVQIKRFYKHVLSRVPRISIPSRSKERKIFMALSREEVERITAACNSLKHYTLLLTAYSIVLRVSEMVKLQPVQIERSYKDDQN